MNGKATMDISPQLESFGITPDGIDAHILELRVERDEQPYHRGHRQACDDLALQLEQGLSKNSCIAWHVCRYDEILHDAHAPSEAQWGVMAIWFQVDIERQIVADCIYVARALVEGADDHIAIIKNLVAEQIALALIEKGIV